MHGKSIAQPKRITHNPSLSMILLPSISDESGPMADIDQLEGFINDMAEICCLSRRKHPEHHDKIMNKFLEIESLARKAFGWTLTVPIGFPEGLSPVESAQLETLMKEYEFSDDTWTEDTAGDIQYGKL
jgi:hypothetical protein